MFLELHMHEAKDNLEELSKILLKFFRYTAKESNNTLDKIAFQRSCPEFSEWFLDLLQKETKNGSAFRDSVKMFFTLPQLRRAKIYCALKHDNSFAEIKRRERFYFWAPRLTLGEQKLLHKFFFYFYEVIFQQKQGIQLSDHICGATREVIHKSYFSSNPHLEDICPVCLHHMTDAAKESDLEHYFPKSIYPGLILNPYNLYFICKICNQTYKRVTDILEDDSNLGMIFLPYLDIVQKEVAVKIKRVDMKDVVRLRATNPGSKAAEQKIERFDSAYQLSSRWSKDLHSTYKTLRHQFSRLSNNKEVLGDIIKDELKKLDGDVESPKKYIETVYKRWVLLEQSEAFLSEVTQDTH